MKSLFLMGLSRCGKSTVRRCVQSRLDDSLKVPYREIKQFSCVSTDVFNTKAEGWVTLLAASVLGDCIAKGNLEAELDNLKKNQNGNKECLAKIEQLMRIFRDRFPHHTLILEDEKSEKRHWHAQRSGLCANAILVFVLMETRYDVYYSRFLATQSREERKHFEPKEFEARQSKIEFPDNSEGFTTRIRCRVGLPFIDKPSGAELLQFETDEDYQCRGGFCQLIATILKAFDHDQPALPANIPTGRQC